MKAIAVLVVLVLANGVNGESTYACWGGCYNKCFMVDAKAKSDSLACDYTCLSSCIPPTASDYKYYCQLGCYLKRCIPVSIDDARFEKCFGWCTNLCSEVQLHE